MKTIEERAKDLYNMLPLIQEYHIDTIVRALRDAMRHQKAIDTRKACDWFKQTHEYWLDDNGVYDMDAALDAFREVMEEQVMKTTNKYYMSFEEAQEYVSKRGLDVPWNDCDVFIDEREITRTVGNVLKWAVKTMIDKACEWLKENARDYACATVRCPYGEEEEIICDVHPEIVEDFKKAMEE